MKKLLILLFPLLSLLIVSSCVPGNEDKPSLGGVVKLSQNDYSIALDSTKTNTYILTYLTDQSTPMWSYDGELRTDRATSFYFPKKGEYNIVLRAFNKAGISDSILIPISVSTSDPMAFNIEGGNMENSSLWQITNLNSNNPKPSGIWNYTTDTPKDGKGGCLYVSGNTSSGTLHYAIYQKVSLVAGASYKFDGAFKDITPGNLDRFWCEIYVGTTAPSDGSDYGSQATKIKQYNSWDPSAIPAHKNEKFSASGGGGTGVYACPSTKDYYLVIKMGTTTWDGMAVPFNILLDELSFKRI